MQLKVSGLQRQPVPSGSRRPAETVGPLFPRRTAA